MNTSGRLAGALDEECALTNTVAEVMKFGAADFAFGSYFDFGDTWGVERENALDSLTVGNFTDGECGVDATAAFGYHKTCEDLNTLFAALDHTAVHFYGVADVE